MKVISTELLIRTASEAMFKKNENFQTDIKNVIDFLERMEQHFGFEIVRCKECKYGHKGENRILCKKGVNDMLWNDKDFFCSDGELKTH